MRKLVFLLVTIFLLPINGLCQIKEQNTQQKVTGYVGILHPIVTANSKGMHTNFEHVYAVGIPVGVNLWKSERIGFSVEFVPLIQASDSNTKMSNILFHPGAVFKIGNGFSIAVRLAFEQSGRYGFTQVLNKTVIKKKTHSCFIAVPLPVRFGNDQPPSISAGFQFGIAF
jgi:hypothetical protein